MAVLDSDLNTYFFTMTYPRYKDFQLALYHELWNQAIPQTASEGSEKYFRGRDLGKILSRIEVENIDAANAIKKDYQDGYIESVETLRVPIEGIEWYAESFQIDNLFLSPQSDSIFIQEQNTSCIPNNVGTEASYNSGTYPKELPGYETRLFAVLEENIYVGHGWVYISSQFPEYVGITGITGTLMAVISTNPKWKGITQQLITAAINFARLRGRTSLVIPSPPANILPLLEELGFTEHYGQQKTERGLNQFFSPYMASDHWYQASLNSNPLSTLDSSVKISYF